MKHSSEDVKLDIRQRTSPSVVSSSSKVSLDEQAIEQDKKLLRKIDWRIVPWIFCLYFLSVEDRSNVGYAMTMNKAEKHTLAETANLSGKENNIGLGLFYVAYIVSEYKQNKKLYIFFFFKTDQV